MKLLRVLSLGGLFAALVSSQGTSKRPLTHRDYDSWKGIAGQQLSRDGKFLAYSLFPQEGDGELVIRDLAAGKDWRFAAGAIPPAPETENEENPEAPPPVRGIRIAITSDSKFVVATTFPPKAEADKARKERRRPDQMPRGGMVIVELATGKETRLADVASMQVPAEAGAWVAYKKGPKPNGPAAPPEPKPADGEDQRGGARPGGPGARPEYGTDLVLRDLATGAERTFEDAAEYSFSKFGALVYTVASRKEENNGVYAAIARSTDPPRVLLAGKGRYTRPAWDRTESQLAFLSNKDDGKTFKAYWWHMGIAKAMEISDGTGLAPGFAFAERGPVSFSRDATRIYFSAAPASRTERSAAQPAPAPGANDERVLADLWHWKDDFIQPMQKVRAAQDRSRTYRAVFHAAEKKLVQIADPSLQTVSFSDDGRWAIGSDDRKYRSMVDYDGNYADLHLVDTSSGTRKPLIEKFRGNAVWSPKGNYALAFKKGDWWSVRIADGFMTNLTAALGVKFFNEEHDSPSEPTGYGNAGWTKGGDGVLLYDQYDVWYVAADGRTSRRLTQGREQKTQFRVVRLDGRGGGFGGFGGGRGPAEEEDDEERGLDPAKTHYLRAENTVTRDTGFYALGNLTGAAPTKLLMGAKNFRAAGKARNADVVLVTATTFADEPNLHVTDSSFRSLKQVTEANPQKAGILWGAPGELFSFKSTDGVPLQAALYKPENFDPKKKYPLMVYIYERLSQSVHNFVRPAPGTSVNFAYYVSNGYLVMTPDIVYNIGSPGQSALKCVLPAVQELVDRGIVDENAIGIQGHSWGGYQISYMVTRTNRFRAAEAGAPVGNMTSAYNGIRWGSGLPRQFQYEKTQSRIGGTLWESTLDFIENSPVFRANRVQTPLLILHDDEDDAVPWYQGIELFLSLRRNGKEAYLFNYNGEKHGLRKRHNQKDYTVRMQQFFDHFLKGAPKPEWMEKGIPYNEREDEKKRFNTAAYGEPSGDR